MEPKPGSQIQSAFLWTATIIGFLVDTVALIGLFSTFRLGDASATGVPTVEIPKINIASIALKWKDVSLVIIIYLFFALIAYYRFKCIRLVEVEGPGRPAKKKQLREVGPDFPAIFIGSNAVMFLTFLWLMVFIYPSSTLWNSFHFIIVGWLFSIAITAIASYAIVNGLNLSSTFIRIGVFIFWAAPVSALIVAWIFDLSFLPTLEITLLSSIIAIVYTAYDIVALPVLFMFTSWLTKGFYGLKEN